MPPTGVLARQLAALSARGGATKVLEQGQKQKEGVGALLGTLFGVVVSAKAPKGPTLPPPPAIPGEQEEPAKPG